MNVFYTPSPLAQVLRYLPRWVWQRQALGLLFAIFFGSVAAAPADALLTALPEHIAPHGYVELGFDNMDGDLDFFHIRDSAALLSGTQAGDYHGTTLAGVWRASERWWLSGSYMDRNISGLGESYHISSWMAAGQYRVNEGHGWMPTTALRLAAWGNNADQLGSSTPVAVPGAVLSTVAVQNAADSDWQLDLIGSWQLTPATDLSAFVSAGNTQLSYGAITGTATLYGCNYNLQFSGNNVVGNGVSPSCKPSYFSTPTSTYGVNIPAELGWGGNFFQAGLNTQWTHGALKLRAGYLYYAIQRQSIDDILAARGWTVTNQTQELMLEGSYQLHRHLSAYVRGQLSSTLIFNEVPVGYNSFSSDLFAGKYSIYTVGLRAEF